MVLLVRIVSPYTAADRLLGAFVTEAEAARARLTYLEGITLEDPWAKQAYRRASPDDVRVVAGTKEINVGDAPRSVFIVSEYEESMGQISVTLKAVCGAEADARRLVAELDAGPALWAAHRRIREVEVGALLDDRAGEP